MVKFGCWSIMAHLTIFISKAMRARSNQISLLKIS